MLDADDGGHPLAQVLSAEAALEFAGQLGALGVAVDGAGEGRPEAGEVGAAVLVADGVGETGNLFVVGVSPLQRDLDLDTVLVSMKEMTSLLICVLLTLRSSINEASPPS